MYIDGYYNKLKEIGFFYWIDHVYYKLLCLWSKYTDASDDEAPNEEMLEGIERFVNLGINNDNQYLTDTYTVLAHCQLDESNYWTECPGDAFLEEIRDMPHWEMAESYYESTCESSTYHSYNTSTYRNASDCTSESDYDYPKGYDEKLFGPWDKINFD